MGGLGSKAWARWVLLALAVGVTGAALHARLRDDTRGGAVLRFGPGVHVLGEWPLVVDGATLELRGAGRDQTLLMYAQPDTPYVVHALPTVRSVTIADLTWDARAPALVRVEMLAGSVHLANVRALGGAPMLACRGNPRVMFTRCDLLGELMHPLWEFAGHREPAILNGPFEATFDRCLLDGWTGVPLRHACEFRYCRFRDVPGIVLPELRGWRAWLNRPVRVPPHRRIGGSIVWDALTEDGRGDLPTRRWDWTALRAQFRQPGGRSGPLPVRLAVSAP